MNEMLFDRGDGSTGMSIGSNSPNYMQHMCAALLNITITAHKAVQTSFVLKMIRGGKILSHKNFH